MIKSKAMLIFITLVIAIIALVALRQYSQLQMNNPAIPKKLDMSNAPTQSAEVERTSNEVSSSDTRIKEEKITAPVVASMVEARMTKTALLANGCFWCAENDLEKRSGVINVVSGYAGGTTESPTYKNYSAGGHREVVLVTYDANVISFANLVEHTIKHGDPTDSGGSFFDRGQEYAPAIYFETAEEEREARRVIGAVDALKVFTSPLPLRVEPRIKFWPAEDYHQDYAKKNPIRYSYYRGGSGRDAFIKTHWGDKAGEFTVSSIPKNINMNNTTPVVSITKPWLVFVKPTEEKLRATLTPLQYKVTQEDGTEPSFNNVYDKNYSEGIYVDIVSGEPLYLSKDKYDSGTGWPSFVKPISLDVLTLKEDNTFFSKRTEVRSRIADSHIGHVFSDGPTDRGGLRYCMNSAALRFVPKADMEREGYAEYISHL